MQGVANYRNGFRSLADPGLLGSFLCSLKSENIS